MSVFPVDLADLPADRRAAGHESRNFDFDHYGVRFGDRCMIRHPLPDYDAAAVEIGRWVPGEPTPWDATRVRMPMSDDTLANYIKKYETVSSGEPLARAEYDVYLDGGDLVYLKQPCAESDTRGRFLLSVFPLDIADIPQDRREFGHEGHNFDFEHSGVRFGDRCMIRRPLPDYAIAAVEIGRWIPGGATAWGETRVRMPMNDAARAYYAKQYETVSASGEPLFAGEYGVYLDGGDLVYLKQPCEESDTRGRFLLSVFPADLGDIPQDRREAGHEGHNFNFADYGIRFGDMCMIRRSLPDYDVESVEIGRWIPGEGGVWTAEVPLPADGGG